MKSLGKIVSSVFGISTVFFALVSSGRADPLVTWNQDSDSGFSVNISGVLSSQGNTGNFDLSSPTGLWNVDYLGSLISFFGDGSAFGGAAHMDASATTGSYLGAESFSFNTLGGYGCMIWGLPESSGNFLHTFDPNGTGWSGMSQTAFVGAQNVDDLATWNYSVDISMHGPSSVKVPDGGLTAGLLGTALLGMALFGRRFLI